MEQKDIERCDGMFCYPAHFSSSNPQVHTPRVHRGSGGGLLYGKLHVIDNGMDADRWRIRGLGIGIVVAMYGVVP